MPRKFSGFTNKKLVLVLANLVGVLGVPRNSIFVDMPSLFDGKLGMASMCKFVGIEL